MALLLRRQALLSQCVSKRKLFSSPVAIKRGLRSTAACWSGTIAAYNHFNTLDITRPAQSVMQVAINRPTKANSMNSTFFLELKECVDKLAVDPDCRVIIICGSGNMFSAGLDLDEHADVFREMTGASDSSGEKSGGTSFGSHKDSARTTTANMRFITRMQESLGSLQSCPKPVISAVHSGCIGAGVDLVCASDVRLATSDAWFSIKEVDIGLCADLGTLQRLQKLIGNDSLVRELVFTARRFSAAEALAAGFLSTTLHSKEELLDHAHQLGSQMASRSPVAIQGSKVNLNYGRDYPTAQALQYQALWSAAMLQTRDIPSALAAAVQHKPPPTFPPL